VYYIAPDGKLMAAPVATQGAAIEPGAPVTLFQTRIEGGGSHPASGQWHWQYDVAPDGRFLINVYADDASTAPITVIQNLRLNR
jgi:hypothetical protein